jgi:hypothetical protein
MLLTIQNNLVLCSDDELKLFISYPDHAALLARPGMDISLQPTIQFPDIFEGKYNLQIVESFFIQSQ